jgi:hypothetical protein
MRSVKVIFLLIIILSLISCKSEITNRFLVTRIRNIATLSTTEVIITKVVWSEMQNRRFIGFLSSKKVLLFETEATMKFGIDLNKIQLKDITFSGDTLKILLPPVELLNFSYPHEKFRQINPVADFDLIKNKDKINLLDEVFREAEMDIKNKAKRLKLEQEAATLTILFMETFLGKLGYKNIYVGFR